jgi:hypothetical protein
VVCASRERNYAGVRIDSKEGWVGSVPAVPERADDSQPDDASLQARAPERGGRLRVSDDERHRVVEVLGEHAAVGRITLSELEERVTAAYASTTHAELAALTQDLPALPERPTRQRKPARWFFAIMGGSTRRGKRRLSGRLNVVSIMGGDEIDLREAEIEGSELVVNAFSLMGGSNVYVPDTVEVELSGPAIMGGNEERGSAVQARPGAPVIQIRSLAIMGGLTVWRLPPDARGLGPKEARRAAKAIERGRR